MKNVFALLFAPFSGGWKMDFSWLILTVVVVVNLGWIGLMFAAQQLDKSLPPRGSIIPGTNQKFLYMQDFWTMTWGDLIGVALINTAFGHLAAYGRLGPTHWIVFVFLAFVLGTGFQKMCLGENHKPDWGYPKIGHMSAGGYLHLPYFGTGVACAVFDLWFIFTGDLRGVPLYVGFAGAAVYFAAFIAEIKSGNFDPLKKI